MRSKKKQSEHFLILDIRSSSVGGALVSILPNIQPEIFYTTRKNNIFHKKQTADIYLQNMLSTLQLVLEDVSNKGLIKANSVSAEPVRIDKIICVYGSPWYISHLRAFSVNNAEEFKFTRKHLKDILEKENEFAKDLDQKIAGHAETIEKELTRVELNGYLTKEPFDKIINSVKASFYMSLFSKETKKTIEESIHNFFPRRKIRHNSFPLVAYNVIESFFAIDESYLVVDVSGELSEVSVVYQNGLNQNFSFPIGYNSILREISEVCQMSMNETESWIKMYADGVAHSGCNIKAKKVFAEIENRWIESFTNLFKKNVPKDERPNHVFLMANSVTDNFISEFFAKKMRDLKQDFTVQKIDQRNLSDLHVVPENVSKDPFLLLISLFLTIDNRPVSV